MRSLSGIDVKKSAGADFKACRKQGSISISAIAENKSNAPDIPA